MHTTDEAKKLWCPMERGDQDYCCADQCAMWRWERTTTSVPDTVEGAGAQPARVFREVVTKTHGYCGLAGGPPA